MRDVLGIGIRQEEGTIHRLEGEKKGFSKVLQPKKFTPLFENRGICSIDTLPMFGN